MGTATGDAGSDTLIGIENVIGGLGNDTLTGDAGTNTLVGGVGNDVLDGGAGDDVLRSASGDDVLVFDPADVIEVNGGSGSDTLVVSGSGTVLDLTAINASEDYNRFMGIEMVDLSGTGNNTLTLDLADLLYLSDSSNTLRVDGDAGDSMTTSDTGWGAGAVDADIVGYTTFTNGEAKLIVDSEIVQAGIQS